MAHAPGAVLVTGATGGIGVAACRRLAASGYQLVLAARNPKCPARICRSAQTSGVATGLALTL